MTALQTFCEKLFLEEETSMHERSILLVDTMNALGFSKCEREIHRHECHLRDALLNSYRTTDKFPIKRQEVIQRALLVVSIVTKATTIMICYSHLAISSYSLYVQTISTTPHCYSYMKMKIMIYIVLWKKMTTFQDM